MNWIFDHLQLLFIVGGAVAWWLNQRKEAAAEEASASRQEKSFEDPELAERTRRIREEIQRKIEQRGRNPASPPVAREDRGMHDLPPVMRDLVLIPSPEPVRSRQEIRREAEVLEQQAALAEQLAQAKEMKAAAARRIQFEFESSGRGEPVAAMAGPGTLADDLGSPEALRRAFILREVLGPPVALR